MTAPIPFRKFKRLVRQYGCSVVRRSKEWGVVNEFGKLICTFAVSHGKQEVKPVYIRQFLEAVEVKNQ